MAGSSVNLAHLRLACGYVTNTWFPANASVVTRVREGLSGESTPLSLKELIETLRGDFGLSTLLVARLRENARSRSLTPATPQAILSESFQNGELRRLFHEGELKFSRHSFDSSNSSLALHQLKQIRSAMVSSAGVELLAQASGLDPFQASTCALLRQLGLALIAWNYPHVFERASDEAKNRASIESRIDALLGFSPTLLGATVIGQWHLDPDVEAVIGGALRSRPLADYRPEVLTMIKLCEVGEALARASDPLDQHEAQQDWEFARSEIERVLGDEGMYLVHERITELCRHYRTTLPNTFPMLEQSQPHWNVFSARPRSGIVRIDPQRNEYLGLCDLTVQRALIELYSSLNATTVSAEAITTLAQKVVPQAGFARGCIYLADPVAHHLVPRYSFGDLVLRSLKPLPYGGEETIFSTAFKSLGPIVQEGRLADGSPIVLITGPLGIVQRIGVLYLESMALPEVRFRRPELGETRLISLLVSHYKAIRETITDILNIV